MFIASVCLSVGLSVCLSVCLSVRLSVCQSVCLKPKFGRLKTKFDDDTDPQNKVRPHVLHLLLVISTKRFHKFSLFIKEKNVKKNSMSKKNLNKIFCSENNCQVKSNKRKYRNVKETVKWTIVV